jgi:hypothetical protein
MALASVIRAPDFAIVGAAKCGTTALYAYLAAHDGVAMSSRKEPCYWSPDVVRTARIESRVDYEGLWAGAPAAALRGEASTAYIESRVAIPAILRERPDALLIAMVRNPLEMAAARHSDLLNRFQEDVGDFETAWRLQDVRRRGERLPRECTEPNALQYADGARIGDLIERFFETVPEAQRLVILFDDLKAEPRAVYLRTLDFLGLADDGRRYFAPVNANRNMRSTRLAALHRSIPRRLKALYAPTRAAARKVGISPSRIIDRFNREKAPRPLLRPAFEAELLELFAPQTAKLSALLGRDLAHWTKPKPSLE